MKEKQQLRVSKKLPEPARDVWIEERRARVGFAGEEDLVLGRLGRAVESLAGRRGAEYGLRGGEKKRLVSRRVAPKLGLGTWGCEVPLLGRDASVAEERDPEGGCCRRAKSEISSLLRQDSVCSLERAGGGGDHYSCISFLAGDLD